MIAKKKEKGILRQSTISFFIVTLIVFASIELILLNRSYNALIQSHDENLLTLSEAVKSSIDVDSKGVITVDYDDEIIAIFKNPKNGSYFTILLARDKSLIGQSHSLAGHNISVPQNTYITKKGIFWEAEINNRPVRFLAFREEVFPDSEDYSDKIVAKHRKECFFFVGKELSQVKANFDTTVFLTSTVLLLGLSILLGLGRILLVYNLKPLNQFNNRVKGISESNLNPIEVPSIKEIKDIAETLNEVISGLKGAFEREQRFTSNVAHELRTPISEILVLVEVVMKYWDRLPLEERQNYRDIFGSARQMQAIVESLLLQTRYDSKALMLKMESFSLRDLVNELCSKYEPLIAEEQISFSFLMDENIVVTTDREMMRVIIDNLISNAARYSKKGSEISIVCHSQKKNWEFYIRNRIENLEGKDIPYIFERFWRKDESRTSGSKHSGLGLSLVKSLIDFLSLEIKVELVDGKFLKMSIANTLKTDSKEELLEKE